MSKMLLFIAICCIVLGCTDESSISVPEDSAPIFQQNPSWSDAGILYFYNTGIIKYNSIGSTVNINNCGIVRFDIDLNQYAIVFHNGITPYVAASRDIVVCQYENSRGPLYLLNQGAAIRVEDHEVWGWRVYPSINSNGTLLSWESRDVDHAIGVWVYNNLEQSYTYIGVGAYPVWKPCTDIVLYRRINDSNDSELIEYNCNSSSSKIVYTLPEGSRYICGAYSPEGDKFVYCGVTSDNPRYGIYILDMNTKILTLINHHYAKGLSWGNSGIVYSNGCRNIYDSGCGVLWILNPETLDYHQLTERMQFVQFE